MGAIISGGVRKIGIVAPNRIVRACNRTTGALVEQTVSDIVGNYIFQNLDTGVSYYVYALDETFNQYNAAIADVLRPKPLFSFTGTATGTVSNSSNSTTTFNITSLSIATAPGAAISTVTYSITAVSIGNAVAGAGASNITFNLTGEFVGLAEPIFELSASATATVLVDASSSTTTNITDSAIATVLVDASSSNTTNITDSATGTVV